MDSILKVVYPHKIVNPQGYIEYLLNGVHPAVIEYIDEGYKKNPNTSTHILVDEIRAQNPNSNWDCFFRHSNFMSYYIRHYRYHNIVDLTGVVDDGSIYVWPIEVGGSLDDFHTTKNLTIGDQEFKFTFINTIDPLLLDYIKKGLVKILINIIHDPLTGTKTIWKIEKYFEGYGINPSNIILLGGNDLKEYYQEFPQAKIKITYGYIMVQQAGDRLDNFPYVSSLGYVSDAVRESDLDSTKLRPKRFLCWNRTARKHRIWLAYLALKHNLLENSYFSFITKPGGGLRTIEAQIREISDNSDVETYAPLIHNLIPHDLDTHHLDEDQRRGFPTNNNKKEFYANSYVHITSETIFGEKLTTPFFSEKTFHAMVNLQPFIYVGCAGALKLLKSWGIKTFHPFIDESYDEETNEHKRFAMIENEIKKLNDMPIEDLHNWYYSITDILLHNQQVLKNFAPENPFEKGINDIIKFYGN